jgi:hypothetical protein
MQVRGRIFGKPATLSAFSESREDFVFYENLARGMIPS